MSDIEKKQWDAEVLREMKRQGMPKPDEVTWAEWNAVQSINHRHDEIIRLMLEGKTKTYIAEALGMSYHHIVQQTNTPIFRQTYADRRNQRDMPVDKKRLQNMFGSAVDVAESIMMNEDEKGSVRLSAAQYFMDQSVGKASQEVQHKQQGLIDVLNHLDEMKRQREAGERDATPTVLLDKPIDPIDALLDQVVPDGFTVGEKKETGSDGEIPEAES